MRLNTAKFWLEACKLKVETPGAQMLRVGGDGSQRLGCGPEQQVVDGRLVLERDGADRSRQGEDDVIIGNRQQFRFAVFDRLQRDR